MYIHEVEHPVPERPRSFGKPSCFGVFENIVKKL
jgi:hypothetical protein